MGYIDELIELADNKYDELEFPIDDILFEGATRQTALNLLKTLQNKKLFKFSFDDLLTKKKYIDFNLYNSFAKYYAPLKKQEIKDNALFWLDYDNNKGYILLNNCLIWGTTKQESDTGKTLTYLLGNANRDVPMAELEAQGIQSYNDNYTFIRNLKFDSDLGRLFFPKSKNTNKTLLLRNPIYKKHIEDADFPKLDLRKFSKASKTKVK